MAEDKLIIIFQNEPVRRIWSKKDEKWYFSLVDIISVLTESERPRKYWDDLKRKIKEEGFIQLSDKIGQLKMPSADGKLYLTDVADVETCLRIVQSIPSPKAEPFKSWLAKVGYERMKETIDPEIGLNRSRDNWKRLGRSEKWIEKRMSGQETRNKLTDYWSDHEISSEKEFAILTNVIHKEWSGLSVREHKELKGINGII
ncbi:MAG: Bro-N domain-containing protein [Candidatus Taylorbacteria bacterium]|nr:Bro-N domain-containing protein [Candidatus Taylorbacteria bacterium]